jgi:hypothetical protein
MTTAGFCRRAVLARLTLGFNTARLEQVETLTEGSYDSPVAREKLREPLQDFID